MPESIPMAPTIFIDGQAGTTGLEIRDRVAARSDLELLEIDPSRRKDPAARAELLAAADLAILCLPDDAAREAVQLAGPATRLIDASTAHRVAGDWVYGLPELAARQREAIRQAECVSNPGCYPTCTSLLLRPLVDAEMIAPTTPITLHALSGYTGGGRSLIERWEDPEGGLLSLPYEAPYALERVHKHVPEMTRYARLEHSPQFIPAVGPFPRGMRVEIPLHARLLPPGLGAKAIWEALRARYVEEPFVRVVPFEDPVRTHERSFDPTACNGTNRVDLHVAGNPAGHVLLVAIIDNLGKGAAGAALQNLNLMLGLSEQTGLSG
jgi:N-acetyl-gamma-glutamyl-phosphate reductase